MCGFLALIGCSVSDRDALAALSTLRHRGPDDEGVHVEPSVWLGHRRLSIIDLGPGGHQPMVEPSTGLVVVYNGEIYNYLELRSELEARGHAFRSTSDTEVLVRSYLEWNADCVEHFNGMWAFVIWDPREQRAFFARDRFGVKPFCYAAVDGGLAIASEPKALLSAFPQLRAVDTSTIFDLLTLKRETHDERTFYSRVKSLLPGHRGTFRPGTGHPQIERYWRYPEPPHENPWKETDALGRLSELITDSVALRLRSDVPVGMTISGGIDSTAILDALAKIRSARGADVTSYTAVYAASYDHGGFDEREWARTAVRPYPNVSLSEVPADVDDWLDVLQRITWHLDGPCRSPQVFPMWMIMERARADGMPVLLEGYGADEVFGGYPHHAALAVIDRLREGPRLDFECGWGAAPAAARAAARAASPKGLVKDLAVATLPPLRALDAHRSTLRDVLSDDFISELASAPSAAAEAEAATRGDGWQAARMYRDFSHDILPGALRFTDAVSMAHSIEVRGPFMDYRLVEFGITLPPPARVAAGRTKRVLRDYLRGVGQREIAERPDKKGFPTPAFAWMADDNGALLRDVLLDDAAKTRAIVDAHKLDRAIARHANGEWAAGAALYSLLATEVWWQQLGRSA
jgi:asparagine synthase (glutamine-hydrolysing)